MWCCRRVTAPVKAPALADRAPMLVLPVTERPAFAFTWPAKLELPALTVRPFDEVIPAAVRLPLHARLADDAVRRTKSLRTSPN